MGIESIDFSHSGVTVQQSHPCQEGSSCCDDDYCRCGVYTHVDIDTSDKGTICHMVCQEFDITDEVDKYVVDRILNNMDGYYDESYNFYAGAGYYGEELDRVWFSSDPERINNAIEHIKELNTVEEKIEFALTVEYGFVLGKLKDVTYELKDISPHKMEAGN